MTDISPGFLSLRFQKLAYFTEHGTKPRVVCLLSFFLWRGQAAQAHLLPVQVVRVSMIHRWKLCNCVRACAISVHKFSSLRTCFLSLSLSLSQTLCLFFSFWKSVSGHFVSLHISSHLAESLCISAQFHCALCSSNNCAST